MLEVKIDSEKVIFAHFVAGGKSKRRAFIEAFGYSDQVQLNRLIDGDTGKLLALLREKNNGFLTEKLHFSREDRIEYLNEVSVSARRNYLLNGNAADQMVGLKAVAILNDMTGDNAPKQIDHLVRITIEQLDEMNPSQRTEAYRRMMGGKLELIDVPQPKMIESTSDHTDLEE